MNLNKELSCIKKDIIRLSNTTGVTVTNTSELVNDGADGINPFIIASDVPLYDISGLTVGNELEFTKDAVVISTIDLTSIKNATHTGDATGATALTLATVNANVGSFGTTLLIPQITVNAKGLITAVANQTIPTATTVVTGLLTSTDWNTFNNKVSNVTHTGEVTGATVLAVDSTAITNKTLVTGVSGDLVLIADASDSFNLKKVDLLDLLGGGGITSLNGLVVGTQTLATGSTGTAPAWVSAGSAHTLNIPLADTTVTSGTISNAAQTIYGAKTFDTNVHTNTYFDTVGDSLSTNGYRIDNIWAIRTNAVLDCIIIGNAVNYAGMTGTGNFLMGREAGRFITSGTGNIGIAAFSALQSLTTGSNNVAIGSAAFPNLVGGGGNVAIGTEAGHGLTASDDSVYIGEGVSRFHTSGNQNVIIGKWALRNAGASCSDNTALGAYAGYGFRTGASNNVTIGLNSMGLSGGIGAPTFNAAVGNYSLFKQTGNYSAAVGYQAGGDTNGSHGTYLGANAGYNSGTIINESNRLRITCHATNQLVYGEGDTKLFSIDGRLRVADGTGTAAAGDIRYDTATSKHQGYDGAIWNNMY